MPRPSPRAVEILLAIVEQGGQIPAAEHLGLARQSVRKCLYRIRMRTGLDRVEQMVAVGIRDGWLDPPSIERLPPVSDKFLPKC